MALVGDDDFVALPPQGSTLLPMDTAQNSGVEAPKFHEIGGAVFEIPPLPDDIEFEPLPPLPTSGSNKGTFPSSSLFGDLDSSLPLETCTALAADSALPPPLTDDPEHLSSGAGFATFTADFPALPLATSPPPLPPVLDNELDSSSPLPPLLNAVPSSNSISQAMASTTSSHHSQGGSRVSPASSSHGDPIADAANCHSFNDALATSTWGEWSGSGGGGGGKVSTPDGFADFSSFVSGGTDFGVLSATTTTTATHSETLPPMMTSVSSTEREEGLQDEFTTFSSPWSSTGPPPHAASSSTTFRSCPEKDLPAGEEVEPFADTVPTTAVSVSSSSTSAAAVLAKQEFGDFSGGGGGEGEDDFGAFTDTLSAPSGSTTVVTVPAASRQTVFGDFKGGGGEEGEDVFGDFGGFNEAVPTTAITHSSQVASTKQEEFGDFSEGGGGEDDFGEFGSFSGPPPSTSETWSKAQPEAPGVGTGPYKQHSNSVVSKDVMFACFPSITMDTMVGVASIAVHHLGRCLRFNTDNSSGVWPSLAVESGSTSSLYQWSQSLLQDHFYGSLKVDAMLAPVSRTTPSPFTGQLGDGLLSPGAGTGLLEGFGFERIIRTEPQWKEDAQDTTFGWDSSADGATLLDLSLPPSSPPPQAGQDISLGADLLGLDFTGAPSVSPDLTHNHAPSSYAVDQSTTTWVDSQLLELGVERAEPLQTPSSVLQRQVTPVSDVEEQLLQLGLDASKTTWRKSTPEAPSSQQKLSEEARTLLETLPDLSFMLSELVATQ